MSFSPRIIGEIGRFCCLLNTQTVVYLLQFRFDLVLWDGCLLGKGLIYHLGNLAFNRNRSLFRQLPADVAYMIFQRLYFGSSQLLISLLYQRIFDCNLSTQLFMAYQ